MAISASGRELWVGPNEQYTSLSAAVGDSESGDTIFVLAGVYENDFSTIQHDLCIIGVDGMAHFQATQTVGNGKGILITNANTVIENLEFSGSTVSSQNGAGIRQQFGDLTVRNSYFHDNENGILAGSDATASIHIENTSFERNGNGTDLTHHIYANQVNELIVDNSEFSESLDVTHIQSRAQNTTVTNSTFDDTGGTASYLINLPNAGNGTIIGNTLVNSAAPGNTKLINYGTVQTPHPGELLVDDNIFINNSETSATIYAVRVFDGREAVVSNNLLVGIDQTIHGTATEVGNLSEIVGVIGSTGDDVLAGTVGRDIIDGSAGNDTVDGGEGDDILIGGAGDDVLSGGSGNDLLIGGGGIDRFIVSADEGDTIIEGYAAGETIDLTARTDVANFGDLGVTDDGVDSTIAFGNGDSLTLTKIRAAELNAADFVFAAPGVTLIGDNGKDTLVGGAGNDTIIGNGGIDVLQGNGGNDIFVYAGSPSGQDTVSGGDGFDRIEGGAGDDTIGLRTHTGVNVVEEIDGGAGDNKIVGHTGKNIFDFSGTTLTNISSIDGAGGADTITGSGAADTIVGGGGNDILMGGAEDDIFLVSGTGNGHDTVSGGDGIDRIEGSAGDDTIGLRVFSGINTVEAIDGGGGFNLIEGQSGKNILDFSGTVLSNIAAIEGGGGADTIIGSSGNDTIIGGARNDRLSGGLGNDIARYSGSVDGYTVVDNGDGTFTVTDIDTSDGNDGADLIDGFAQAVFTDGFIQLAPSGNTAPIAVADNAQTAEDAAATIFAFSLLSNDSDPDGDSLALQSIQNATNGTAALDGNGDVLFTPDTNFNGVATFEYTINDGNGSTASATVSVSVAAENDNPIALSDLANTTEDTSAIFQAAGLLANDTDIDGDPLSIQSVQNAVNGTVSLDSNGDVLFSPGAGFSGSASFDYSVTDGNGGAASATVAVDVAATSAGETLIGGSGKDTLIGGAGDDILTGNGGNDVLTGGGGNDVFAYAGGNNGYDKVSGGDGFDRIVGGTGDDTIGLRTYSAVDTVEEIDGGGGFNIIRGNSSANLLDFGTTTLTNIAAINGGGGNDAITGSSLSDTIEGGSGNDSLSGGQGDDLFVYNGTSNGHDTVSGGNGNDRIQGGVGDDTIGLRVHSGTESVEAIDGGGGANVIRGHSGANEFDFSGTVLSNIDAIEGGGGKDTITGSAGDDTIDGGSGNDLLNGGSGDDVFLNAGTGDGSDTIAGGDGFDTLQLTGAGESFDLTPLPADRLSSMEAIDITGSGDNALTLDIATLVESTTGINARTGTANSLIVDGDSGDTVDAGAGWTDAGTATIGGQGYSVYESTADGVRLFVDTDVGVTVT